MRAQAAESCDWCGMLYRMYTRWAEKKGFSVEVLDHLDDEEAGIKSVTFQVNGENAYGYLKSEKAYNRLVRISLQRLKDRLLRISGCYAGYRRRSDIEINPRICASIPTEKLVQAVSISTKPLSGDP